MPPSPSSSGTGGEAARRQRKKRKVCGVKKTPTTKTNPSFVDDSARHNNKEEEWHHLVVAILSDTHGLLPPPLVNALKQTSDSVVGTPVHHIIHAGDVGDRRCRKHQSAAHILAHLRTLAPTTAVRGNTDDGATLQEQAILSFRCGAAVGACVVRFLVEHGNKVERRPTPGDTGAIRKRFLNVFNEPGEEEEEKNDDQHAPKPQFVQDVIVTGHSHMPELFQEQTEDGTIIFVNPGSAGGPRGFNPTIKFPGYRCAVLRFSSSLQCSDASAPAASRAGLDISAWILDATEAMKHEGQRLLPLWRKWELG
eukprot:CAMPEP_0194058358 /NCGR_PEP_ID=MMETSP0009_2-20130614/66078_1 /TAXON_ID=210454 /ORGANISM="Grammatophora oceanica, Strain CCMP 410" /LENGTH=308 /DNA_ID=CAMNT_0038708481 /DNA_START=290 /DNA_END=1216 /DNA_ORIENTATION=-